MKNITVNQMCRMNGMLIGSSSLGNDTAKRRQRDGIERQGHYYGGITKLLFAITLLFTIGVGQMWAGAGLYEVYFEYSYNGNNSSATYTSSTSSTQTIALGTLTADFKIKSMYPKVWKDGSGNICGCLVEYYIDSDQEKLGFSYDKGLGGNNHQWKNTTSWTVASYNSGASGSYTFWYRFKAWGSSSSSSNCGDNTYYIPTGGVKNKFTYNIAPPAISSFSVAESGYISGSGTSEDPYIMPYNGTLTLTVSGSKGRTDANSTLKYWKNSESKGTDNVLTVTGITSTTKTSVVVHAQCINNSSSSLVGTESTKTVYYKSEAAYSVTVSNDGHGSTTPNGAQSNIGTLSGLSISATPSTGYNFGTWTISSGDGSFTSAATTASNKFKPTAASTITASFNAKTYTITLKKNGADCLSDGSATATYNSGSVTSATYPTYTDYRCDGYYTAADGGDLVLNTDGTLEADVDGYTDGSGNWTKDGDATLYAHWTYDVTNYTVNFGVGTSYTSLGGLTAYNNNTSASISTGASVRSGHSITFTASPNTGYEVEGWYTNAACTLGKHDAGSLTYTASVTGDMNVYVKYVEKTWSVAFAAGTGGAVTTPAATPQTVGQVTGISIAATPATGYTFNTWTITSGSGSFTSAATTNSNTFKPTAASTITASFTETMSSLSTSCHYDAGTPGYAAPTVSGSATNVGYATTRTITATAAGTGYTFAGWTLTNCTRTDGGAATATSITIRSNGDGAAATVVANYNEDLTSRWHLVGEDVTSKVTFPDGWNVSNTSMMQKASGHSTESVVYGEATVSNASGTYEFKVVDDNGASSDIWYGYSTGGTYLTWTGTATKTVYSGDGNTNNLKFTPTVAGTYTFKVDYSGTYPTVTITYPVSYTLTYSVGSVSGNNGSISTSPSTSSGSKVISGTNITLTAPAAKTGYTWKGWYTNAAGTEGKIADTDRAITVTMSADKTLYACYTENTYNVSASASPAAGGSVTPTSATSMGQVNGGNITATPNPGYSFTSWAISSGSGYFGASGTATTSTTANTKFRPTAAATLTGTFSEVMRTVSVVSNNTYLGSVSAASLTSVGPATKSAEVTATPETGATFTRWDVESGVTIASGYTSTSNPVKINATDASKTLTAVFTETKYTVSMSTADGDKGTVGAASASVGQITAVEITATPKSGYMFSKWVKTGGAGTVTYYTGAGNGQVTDASGEEKETTYICVTGNVTLQATWEPDRSSGYVVHYGNSGKNADGGTDASQTRPWKDGKLYRATTEASDVSYFSFTAGVGDVDKVIYFKIWDGGSNWYGYNSASGGKFSSDITDVTLSTDYGDARMCIIMPGTYKFTWNKSTKKLSVAYPDDVYYLRGGFNSWDWSHPMTETSSGVYSATVNMTEANHTYSGDNGFKLLIAGQYYGKNSTTVTRSTSTGSAAISGCGTSGANIGITTDYTGNYTFTYTVASNTLQVTYPTAYKVTYGKGTINGSASNCSAIDIDNGGASVTSNSTWVKSGNKVVLNAPAAKSGYRYLGWYDNNSATGVAETTNANCTITVSSALTRYACYAENMSTITVSAGTGGTVSTGSGTHSLGVTTGVAIDATPSTGYSWSTWTTSGNAALGSSAATKSNTAKGDGTNGGSGTITATFTPNPYDVILDVNGGSGDNQTVTATFAATMPTVQKGGSTPIAARTKTGYNFDGYWSTTTGTGTQYYTSALASNHVWDVATNETHIYAKWNAKQSAITFDYQTGVEGYSSSGDITNASGLKGTYDADMTALTGTMPSADEGYAFTGFYDATSGGTKYYNADGTSAHAWDKDTESGTTLYARWEKAEITALTLDAAIVETNGTVGVTPTISPTPEGDTKLCFYVYYSNDNPLDPQPEISWNGTKATFSAGETSGTYKIGVSLRTGTSCGSGTLLDSTTISYQVAGTHTVTVNYKCGDDVIKAATSETATPLDWSDDITAPDIFGYTFSRWDAADGVTIKNGDSDPVTTSTNATIQIKATYNGNLTAVYTQKSMIFFKNTLGWDNVYVNFYSDSYWNNPKGSGNEGVTNRNKHMIQIGESDIYYYDYGAESISPSLYVSFTDKSRDGVTNFWGENPDIKVVYPANYADDIHTNKSSENGFKAATPMFVPLATQEPVTLNSSGDGKANYYNAGYWTTYTQGTGYRLEIYDNSTGSFIKGEDFTSADDLMPMKAKLDLEGNTTYKFQLRRGGESSAGIYYGNSGTMTYANHGQGTPWAMTNGSFSMCKITTNAAGDYTFNLSYSPNADDQYRLRMEVDYPIADGDYRLIYSDATQTKPLTSAIVSKENNGSAIVSFFVRKYVEDVNTPVLRIQQASLDGSGNITWNEYPTSGTPTNQITGDIASAIDATGVYNFNLSMNGSGALSVASAEPYTGNFYIRTDAANSKWDNYRTDPDHLMTYSEYSITHGGYSHYYTHWVNKDDVGRKNVKFVIANDYSPCISDTLAREEATGTWANIATFMEEGGDLKRSANVRFMWNQATNEISRAYIDGSQEDGSQFLLLLSDDSKIKQGGATKTQVTFNDNGNWLYEANISALPNAQIKLKSTWGEGTTIDQYFKGASDATETLVGGSGEAEYNFRLIYDFKTNRLLASYVPATGTISTDIEINADVMFVREHQDDIEQLTFSGSGAISDIKTAYGVMRFNKWTINNKDKSTHDPLPLPQPSRFERDIFYVSFPFRVNLEEVFGFGTYGTHWIIEEYDGAARAEKGFWADSKSFWNFIWDRKGKFLEPNTGYILALDLDELGESSSVWANTDQVELYFPSYGPMPTITSSSVTYNVPAHTCTINRPTPDGDRRIKDSHWNVMSVPTYVNTSNVSFANTTWTATRPNFLYTWNKSDNTLSATSGVGYTYHAMHAYMVQYCGDVTWTTSVSPAPAVGGAPRRNPNAPKDAEYRLELSQNDKMVDQTFVRLSNDEHVTTGFEFNYDLSKEFNKNKANIYTMVSTMIDGDLSITETAGNTLPMTEQTTVVPVGVKIATTGDYTFAIPEGTNGVGVTLIDNETGIRTSLSALDYTVNLNAGTYNERFVLEISPVNSTPTGIENGEWQNGDGARKVLIDNHVYIIRGDKMYDATGALVNGK